MGWVYYTQELTEPYNVINHELGTKAVWPMIWQNDYMVQPSIRVPDENTVVVHIQGFAGAKTIIHIAAWVEEDEQQAAGKRKAPSRKASGRKRGSENE